MLTDVDGYVQQVLQGILSSCEGTVSVRPITSLTSIFHLISAQRPRGVNAIKGILEFGNLWSVPLIFVVMWQQHVCGSTRLPLCEPMSARRLEKMESESKYNKKVSVIQHECGTKEEGDSLNVWCRKSGLCAKISCFLVSSQILRKLMYGLSGPTENAFIWRWTDGISELKSFHILCCCARFKEVEGLS